MFYRKIGVLAATGCRGGGFKPIGNGGQPFPSHAGTSPRRAGTSPDHAGTSPRPAGTSPDRAGSSPRHAGTSPELAGTSPHDAGTSPDHAVKARNGRKQVPDGRKPVPKPAEQVPDGGEQVGNGGGDGGWTLRADGTGRGQIAGGRAAGESAGQDGARSSVCVAPAGGCKKPMPRMNRAKRPCNEIKNKPSPPAWLPIFCHLLTTPGEPGRTILMRKAGRQEGKRFLLSCLPYLIPAGCKNNSCVCRRCPQFNGQS